MLSREYGRRQAINKWKESITVDQVEKGNILIVRCCFVTVSWSFLTHLKLNNASYIILVWLTNQDLCTVCVTTSPSRAKYSQGQQNGFHLRALPLIIGTVFSPWKLRILFFRYPSESYGTLQRLVQYKQGFIVTLYCFELCYWGFSEVYKNFQNPYVTGSIKIYFALNSLTHISQLQVPRSRYSNKFGIWVISRCFCRIIPWHVSFSTQGSWMRHEDFPWQTS